jgi:hypothetical protein
MLAIAAWGAITVVARQLKRTPEEEPNEEDEDHAPRHHR